MEAPRHSALDEAIGVLAQAGVVDDEHLRDALWLSRFLPVYPLDEGHVPRPEQSNLAPPPDSGEPSVPPTAEARSEDGRRLAPEAPLRPRTTRLFATGHAAAAGAGLAASRVVVPASGALPQPLELARALRPFARRIAGSRLELDEAATAEKTAESSVVRPFIDPVFRRAPERWFSLSLVFDATPAMVPWRRTALELERLLAGLGNFRDVRLWELTPDVRLYSWPPHRTAADPRQLCDPSGRSIVVMLTNGVGAHWRTRGLMECLKDWAKAGPVAICSLLPPKRWAHTDLGSAPLWVQAPTPGVKNALLRIGEGTRAMPVEQGAAPYPVFPLTKEGLARWAGMLMSRQQTWTAGVLLSPEWFDEKADQEAGAADVPHRVSEFAAIASPEAIQLLRYLAAVPLTLPIMRLVQATMLPESSLAAMSEVLMSGLIRPANPELMEADPENVLFDFVPGAREELRALTPIVELERTMLEVRQHLREYIEAKAGYSLHDFEAWVMDPEGEETLPSDVRHFAEVMGDSLAALGYQGKQLPSEPAESPFDELPAPLPNEMPYGETAPLPQESAASGELSEDAGERSPKLYIGYAHGGESDAEIHRFVERLQWEISVFLGKQTEVVFDLFGLPFTMGWDALIEQQIRASSAFVAFVAENYLNSEFCLEELHRFQQWQSALGRNDLVFLVVWGDYQRKLLSHSIVESVPGDRLVNFEYARNLDDVNHWEISELARAIARSMHREDAAAGAPESNAVAERPPAAVVPSNCVSIPLKLTQRFIYAAEIDNEEYLRGTEIYLAISSREAAHNWISRIPQLVKTCSATHIEHLIKRALPGIPLMYVPSPPMAVPVKLGYLYFSLNRNGPMWSAVQRERNFAAYVPADFPDPELELVILLPGARSTERNDPEGAGQDIDALAKRRLGESVAMPQVQEIAAGLPAEATERIPKMYVSYARGDKASDGIENFVERLQPEVAGLMGSGVAVVRDPSDGPFVWHRLLEQDPTAPKVFLAFLSRDYVASGNHIGDLNRFSHWQRGLGRNDLMFLVTWRDYPIQMLPSWVVDLVPRDRLINYEFAERLDDVHGREVRELASTIALSLQQEGGDAAANVSQGVAGHGREEEAERDETEQFDEDAYEPAVGLSELYSDKTPAKRRMEIGERLAELGDRRPGVGISRGIPKILWQSLPAGAIRDRTAGRIQVEPFRMAAYPVTVMQFAAFVDAKDGYDSLGWWQGLVRLAPDKNWRHQPPNCPVTRVNWFDAVAYCRWLTAKLRLDVRLPFEAEWQFAAQSRNPEFAYPWGPEWWSGRANTLECRLGRPTAVGVFPQGNSLQGIADLAGNVWEWCANLDLEPRVVVSSYDKGPSFLRGGSWQDNPFNARADDRLEGDPHQRTDSFGFRVVCPVSQTEASGEFAFGSDRGSLNRER